MQVKGEVKLVNTANTPLCLKNVMVKIVCDEGKQKPITVQATCAKEHYSYGPDIGPEGKLTIPTTAGPDNPVSSRTDLHVDDHHWVVGNG